jgi:hypothetical protein
MQQPKQVNFEYLRPESYVAYIKNSVGTKMFQSYFVKKDGKVLDVLKKGRLSCAVYVSTLLRSFGVIDKLHFTVARTADDLIESGASKIKPTLKDLKPGDVLVWVSIQTQGGVHNHIGFYLGNGVAVSNSDKKLMVVKHHYLFKGKRKIELALRPNFNQKYAKS